MFLRFFYTALPGLVAFAAALIPDSHMSALEKLYNSTDGPRWNLTSIFFPGMSWNFTTTVEGVYLSNPCSDVWYGIGCNKSTIIQLMLSTSSLWGSLPTELGLLTGLQELSLDNNSLEGPIPPELGLLSGLQLLWLSSNSLDGSLPSELGLMTGLSYLDLNSNSLEGPM